MMLNTQQRVKILKTVTDEHLLRKEVLIPIFRNSQQYIQVIDNHGNVEKGTDIVLIEKGKYDEFIYTSVIVKAKKINYATTGKDTAANVMQQMIMASSAGFNCPIQKTRVRFDRLMIVTSQEISGEAQDVLNKCAYDNRVAAVFLWGETLVKQIDQYLPDFYFYKSAQYSQLATLMRKKCEKLYELQKIARYAGEAKEIVDVFVEPRLRNKVLESSSGEKSVKPTYLNLQRILEKHSHVLIVGGPGTGKSTIVREAVLKLQNSNTRDVKPNIPLLVRAVDLVAQDKENFIEAINGVINRDFYQGTVDINDLSDANLYLFIDGLDEIVDLDKLEVLCKSIELYSQNNSKVKIIITSRYTQSALDIKGTLVNFMRWHIMPFNIRQIRSFIENWFRDTLQSERLIQSLQDHNLLSRLPNTPLVLTLLAILFDSDQYKEVPANLSELYQMFMDLMLGKWSLDRRVETMYDANIRQYVASQVALYLHKSESVEISEADFVSIVDECEKTLGHSLDAKILLDDFLNQSALLSKDGEMLEFTHLSFQEFLVGHQALDNGTQINQQILLENYSNSWWDNVLYFYCGLRKTNSELLPKLIEKLHDLDENRRIGAILEFGYIVQASYLTAVNIRSDAIHEALKQYYHSIDPINEITFGKHKLDENSIFFGFTVALVDRYMSRFLKDLYTRLFQELSTIDAEEMSLDDKYVLLVISLILSELGDTSLLAEAHQIIATQPQQKQLYVLGNITKMMLTEEEFSTGELLSDQNKKELKKIAKKISNKKLQRNYNIRRR